MGVKEVSATYSAHQSVGVPKGYKQSEVGVIPEDWEEACLGSCATFRTGPFGSALHKSDYVQGGVPIINPTQIVDGKLVPTATMSITEAAAQALGEFRLSVGEVVIGRRGDMGRCAVVGTEEVGWLCGTGSMIVRPRPSVDGRFIQRMLSSPSIIRAIESTAVGTTMVNLNQATLSSLVIPIPPQKIEQEAIAETLSDADVLIESLEQLLTKKRQLKQGAMQELLTGRKRLPGFSGEWGNVRFGDIVHPRKERIDPRQSGAHAFCVELEHLGQGTGELLGHTIASIDSSLKSVFYKGDVLFGKLRAYLKKYWRADRDGVCSTEIWVLTPKNSAVSSSYLFQIVMVDDFIEVASSAYGTHMPRSDWNVVKSHELPIPSVEEQNAIATILSDMDAELATLEEKLAKACAAKQGMMQELLTGRIRLVKPS